METETVVKQKFPMLQEITVHPNWLKDEEALMTRLHQIISGFGEGPYKSLGSDHKWQLDDSNDWWARIENGKLILTCRYNYEKLAAFASFARFCLDY